MLIFIILYCLSLLLEYIETERPGKSGIIMDNVAFHKNKEVKAMVEAKWHVIIFLSPYSPFLNPIENMFSKWKQAIRAKRTDNETQLFELINNVHLIVSGDDCAAFYTIYAWISPKVFKKGVNNRRVTVL